ncbi:MAG: Flp pilus assembly protein CpaB [Roseibium sp.]|uniref:Flp pilus assembly protein CpaB n=1 Tax=Roseibium sp. TaxID=1936156 RepID=UPI001B1E0FA6|nr:Flp pilus assembly protein CpaB [Roseibium sp.]MBO6892978.1 Flp pilus assembly protein CpaB [Roseibium sp.]MBO6929421.1 Flp pilus assembly protein CpaB [Roseibium sp.]
MNFLRLFVLAIAGSSGFLAFHLVMDVDTATSDEAIPESPVHTASVQVLVASKNIPLGGKLLDNDFEWIEWPEDSVPSGVVMKASGSSSFDDLTGRIARTAIFSGEPIRSERLISTDKGYMAAILPKGKRAMAVKVEEETSAGGFILPGDKVDVILTRKYRNRAVTSETILENIRVLAIDSTTAGEQDTKNLSPRRTATLEVTLAQSEVVAKSQQVGTISLALRSAEDSADDAAPELTYRNKAKFVRVAAGRWSVGDFQVQDQEH